MANELVPRDAFEAKLLEVYADDLAPMDHAADQIRTSAIQSFRIPFYNEEFRAKTPKTNGDKIVHSRGEYRTTLGGVDTIYTLAFVAPQVTFARRILPNYVTIDWNVQGKSISLIMNRQFDKPAAIIGPSSDELPGYDNGPRSAAVVVNDEVNNPEHLQRILPIVTAISSST